MSYAIGIDLGGTFIKYGLVDRAGKILCESIRPTYPPDGRSGVFDNIIDIINELDAYAADRGFRPEGIGIGAPGIVDEGIVTACEANMPELEGMALGSRIQQLLGMPVSVDNDANLMALAEWKLGAARGATDAIFLTIGTGIGGAMVVNDRLYAGYHNRGAELGHLVVAIDGAPCSCGGRGCLETHASIKALIEDYRKETGEPPGSSLTGSIIFSRYLGNQPAAVATMNRHFDYLAAAIAGLINVFGPQKLVIGGGISEAGDAYIDPIRRRAMDRAMKETSCYTVIEAAQLGNKAGFLGAGILAFRCSRSDK
jgi:glucokinase